ncbi:MAG: hypothetical protein KDC44_24290, partial [Phaeodactylibacter sp.]|nr:hypothetical protein [Phaeodactylibacter sp.]
MAEKFDPNHQTAHQTPAQEGPQIPLGPLQRQFNPPPLQLKASAEGQELAEEEQMNANQEPLQAAFEPPVDPPEENPSSNTPIQRDDDGTGEEDGEGETTDPGPFHLEVPSLSYSSWARNQNRYSLGVDLNLDTGLDFRMSFRQYMEQQLSLPRIRTDLLRVDPNEFFRPIYDPFTSDKKPWELAPGPDPPQEASFGLLWSAIKTTPAVSRILNDVEQQASDAWSGLETGQQVLVGSSMVLVGGAALAGMYINPDTRGLINGVPLPVPGVSGLALELYIPEDNSSFFIGAHLDLGQFLPKSWGFG